MSRIEKGTQRFRPTAVSRRGAPAADIAKGVSAHPATAERPGASSSSGAPPQTSAPARSYAFAPSAGTRPSTRIAPRSAVPISAPTRHASAASAPGPTQVKPSPSQEAGDAARPPRLAATPAPPATGVHPSAIAPSQRAQGHGIGHDASLAHDAGTAMTDVLARATADAGAAAAPTGRFAQPAPPAAHRSAEPRRRPATSISDDEAEYEAQCAQTEADPSSSELPPLRVDVGATRMESIAVTNWKSGRASSRTFELERVRARQRKKRRHETEAAGDDDGSETMKQSGTPVPDSMNEQVSAPAPVPEQAAPAAPTEPELGENRFAVQTRIVDGKIVLDEQSLYANYRDDEEQEQEQRNWEVVDEREGDQFVNSASRSKQRRTQRWSEEETERFFMAISQWGTDFEMITRLFPRRTRREIKSKWTKESRQNAKRLDDAFTRRVAIDLTAYGNAAGVDLSGPPPVIKPKTPDTLDATNEHNA